MRTIVLSLIFLLAPIVPASAQDTGPTDRFPPPRSPLTFLYPADWLVREAGMTVTVANTPALLDFNPEQTSLEPGQAGIQVTVTPAPDGAAALMEQTLSNLSENLTLNEQDERQTGHRSAITAIISGPGYDLLLMLLDAAPDEVFGILLVTAPDELEAFESAALIVAETVEYVEPVALLPRPDATLPPVATLAPITPPTPGQLFDVPENPLTFVYPENWVIRDSAEQTIVATDADMLDWEFGDSPIPSGAASLIIQYIAFDDMPNQPDDFPDEPDAESFMRYTLDSLPEAYTASEPPRPTDLNPRWSGYQTDILGPDHHSRYVVLDAGPDAVAILLLSTAPGELDDFQPALAQVAGTLARSGVEAVPDSTPTRIPPVIATPLAAVTPQAFDTQQFTSEHPQDFPFTFVYPADWAVEDAVNVITVANTDTALAREFGDTMVRGQMNIAVQPFFAGDPGLEPGMDAFDFLQTALSSITEGQPGDIETRVIGDRNAVLAPVRADNFDTLAIVIDIEPGVVMTVLALTGPGQLDMVVPFALLIAESVAPEDNLNEN